MNTFNSFVHTEVSPTVCKRLFPSILTRLFDCSEHNILINGYIIHSIDTFPVTGRGKAPVHEWRRLRRREEKRRGRGRKKAWEIWRHLLMRGCLCEGSLRVIPMASYSSPDTATPPLWCFNTDKMDDRLFIMSLTSSPDEMYCIYIMFPQTPDVHSVMFQGLWR